MEPLEIKVSDKISIEEFIRTEGSTPELAPQIKSFLEPIEPNYKNLEKFIGICNKNNTVSFIGAGTSKPLGIKDWEGLIKELIDYIKSRHSHEISKETALSFPEIAESIFKYLKTKNDLSSYFDIIIKNMGPKFYTTTLTLIKLILFLNVHLTTNFDVSIENAYKFLEYLAGHFREDRLKKRVVKYAVPDFGEYSLDDDHGVIYYLHGNVNKKVFVFKKSDYDIYYPSVSNSRESVSCIEDCLRRFFKEKNILFIGFSFTDTYIKDYFFKIAKDITRENEINSRFYGQNQQVYSPKEISHFLLIDSDNKIWLERKEKLFDELQQFYIYPIVYKAEQYIFLEFLFELMSRRGTQYV